MRGLITITVSSIFALFPSLALAASVTANSTLSRGTQISSGDISVEAEAGENPQDVISHYVGKELTPNNLFRDRNQRSRPARTIARKKK